MARAKNLKEVVLRESERPEGLLAIAGSEISSREEIARDYITPPYAHEIGSAPVYCETLYCEDGTGGTSGGG